jgi:hypothetical protein
MSRQLDKQIIRYLDNKKAGKPDNHVTRKLSDYKTKYIDNFCR